ncbi:hypothetical protein [Arcticibacterium luteifluviistationis]|uniref:DUF3052 domain-containing protein n=1 Tax=Arcticibacterium luteifluviistationis TaxID=1784714 RepID=A0A2Z4GF02_9BACT|nr:hypothetical protein [Arcticibacterium luteifluviistationis]AWV99568.1 hypothetical protein DJ013_15885 [Arcticibacterium luteifluviistationis]
MNTLLKKLNFKTQESILILNTPDEFQERIEEFSQFLGVKTDLDSSEISFSLIFCTTLAEIESLGTKVAENLAEDALFWFAYPKKSSKKYSCEFNRDNGWQVLGDLGFEPVRMVAIDEDWSALRFRKAKHIKTITRNPNWIMSEEGKKKAKK